ncbi:hypothetical protein B0H16DRAFT_1510678 [Mycena metata]|uniref:Uncharacterized protein n=1 Tax=Mycena metata TaxID=1033252 RepID=A0AAD7JXK5_9AGAR|nr:hypothetical protein B0H16DRAFT_1510678 [Mycena metata]
MAFLERCFSLRSEKPVLMLTYPLYQGEKEGRVADAHTIVPTAIKQPFSLSSFPNQTKATRIVLTYRRYQGKKEGPVADGPHLHRIKLFFCRGCLLSLFIKLHFKPGQGREGRPCCPHLQRGCGWSEFASYRGLPRVYVRVFLSFNAFVIQYSIFNAVAHGSHLHEIILGELQEYCRKCSFESIAGHEVESRSLLLQLKLEVETKHRAGPRTRSLSFYIGVRTRLWKSYIGKKGTWTRAPGKSSEELPALFCETP